MAVEYTANAVRTVEVNQNVLFTETVIPCTKGYVFHREGSGIISLRGITQQCRARYRVSFGANIAVPADETAGAISLAIAIDGEGLQSAVMTVTPTVAESFFNVSADIFVDVPRCSSSTISIKNISDISVDVSNANIIIDRVA